MTYQHFKVAIYCRVDELNRIKDLEAFAAQFGIMEKHLCISKVYLETYRGGEVICSREKMLRLKEFFNSRGIATSGGITTIPRKEMDGIGFGSFCYTNPAHRKELQEVVELTAGLFDELILDDFYFTNCKCESCIAAKGDRTWAEFRTRLMKEVSSEVVLQPAKQINPAINMIIKYPNWYEHFQETGYNLADEPALFDMVYTGTETRNTGSTQQHLPRYLSYFNMRYLENVKPGKNGGGWFDPYECSYNLGSYVEQANLTLFGKAREVTLFCLGSLLQEDLSIFVPIAGHVFNTLDKYLGELGNATGMATYIPTHSSGEDFLHNYLGMLGIPLEPYPEFPAAASSLLLTANAARDGDIISKLRDYLVAGGRAVVTSGFLKATQDKGFADIASIRCTDRKALVSDYSISGSGIFFTHCASSGKPVLIPQVEYCTNDAWQLVSGMGEDNNFPVLIRVEYGKGCLYVLTIPEDYGDLYNYPKEVLKPIREACAGPVPVMLDAAARVGLFTYSNDAFVVESFRTAMDRVEVTVGRPGAKLRNAATGQVLEGRTEEGKTLFAFSINPTSYKIFKIL